MMVAGLELTRTVSTPSDLQGAAGLGAGIVKLRRLADDDGAGADDQHLFDPRDPSALSVSALLWLAACGSTNAVEQVLGVLGAAAGLRVELHGEAVPAGCRPRPRRCLSLALRVADAAHLGGQGVPLHRVAVVLAGDEGAAAADTRLAGWLAPRWPYFSLVVLAPAARAVSWWPRQMPKAGMPVSSISRMFWMICTFSAGSPGPLESIRPSGCSAASGGRRWR